MILILHTLGEKQESLAGLGGMSSVSVSHVFVFLSPQVAGQMALLQGILAEPKVFFAEDETPDLARVSKCSKVVMGIVTGLT